MTWPLAFFLVALALICAAAYCYRQHALVDISKSQAEQEKHRTTRAISADARMAAERLERQLHRFAGLHKSDNLAPTSDPIRPAFGRKLHVVDTDNNDPKGAA